MTVRHVLSSQEAEGNINEAGVGGRTSLLKRQTFSVSLYNGTVYASVGKMYYPLD